MKKILFILTTMLLFSSCEKIENEITNEDLFVGTWEVYKLWKQNGNEPIKIEESPKYTIVGTAAYERTEKQNILEYITLNNLPITDLVFFKDEKKGYCVNYKIIDEDKYLWGSTTRLRFSVTTTSTTTSTYNSGRLPDGQSIQCNGTTLENKRCKNVTLNANGYCYQHISQSMSKPEVESIRYIDGITMTNPITSKIEKFEINQSLSVLDTGKGGIRTNEGFYSYNSFVISMGDYMVFYIKNYKLSGY